MEATEDVTKNLKQWKSLFFLMDIPRVTFPLSIMGFVEYLPIAALDHMSADACTF